MGNLTDVAAIADKPRRFSIERIKGLRVIDSSNIKTKNQGTGLS